MNGRRVEVGLKFTKRPDLSDKCVRSTT
jgi:hypothetical protein